MQTEKTVLSFAFRTNKETGVKRPTVEVEAEVPSKDGLVELLTSEDPADAKVQELVIEGVISTLQSHIRSYVDEDKDFDQEAYNRLLEQGKVDLHYIANMPRAERNVLSKDDLEAFAADYIEVMPEITGKEVSRVRLTAEMVVERFKRITGDPEAVKVVKNNIVTFIENAPEAMVETHGRVLTWALNKLETLGEVQVSADDL